MTWKFLSCLISDTTILQQGAAGGGKTELSFSVLPKALAEVLWSEETESKKNARTPPKNVRMGSNYSLQCKEKIMLHLEQEINVCGRVSQNHGRFAVNLESCKGEVVFHFNPRFDVKRAPYIVCNTYSGISWGFEEVTSYVPFQQGDLVHITIKVMEKYYQVSVNGEHILYYCHRLPYCGVTSVSVTGDLNSAEIQICGPDSNLSSAQNPKAPPPYSPPISDDITPNIKASLISGPPHGMAPEVADGGRKGD